MECYYVFLTLFWKESRKQYKVKGLKRIQPGYAKDNLNIGCLAFADNLLILTEELETTAE